MNEYKRCERCKTFFWTAFRFGALLCEECQRDDDALTLATLCDLVLGERALDRSNWALIHAVGRLVRQAQRAMALDKV